jgi:predicted AAA+ superfamily ATPase
MKRRLHKSFVRELLKDYPAVAILGSRQCGKTTLAATFGGVYLDLEQEAQRVQLDVDWDALMAGRRLIVLDEAQCAPEIFPRLRGAIDADRKRNGRFLLLGSVSPALTKNVSESLAGRLATVELSPFILPELNAGQLDDLWLRGGYPDGGILSPRKFPQWQRSYLEMLASRDLPEWGLPAKASVTLRLCRMVAALHGQQWNASQIGNSLDMSYHTINEYVDYLEGAFLLRRLFPWYANIRKRLVKRPKVYWRDSGLLHSLLEVRRFDQLMSQPWVGASWEGFVIEQTMATLQAVGKHADASYFRTADGYEFDLLLNMDGHRWAVEIKLTSNPTMDMMNRLRKAADLVDADRRVLVCRTSRKIENPTTLVTNLSGWLKRLRE